MTVYRLVGKYFEEFELGDQFITARRTMTEADIVIFAGLSSDWNPPHVDQVHAEQSVFKTRIVHGPLLVGVSLGLLTRMGVLEGTSMAYAGDSWSYLGPVKIGDTIHFECEVIQKKASTTKQDRGFITFRGKTVNQQDEVTIEGTFTIMFRTKQESQ